MSIHRRPLRRRRVCRWLLPILLVLPMTPISAQTPSTPAPGSQERAAILDAARAPAQRDLGKPVRFHVRTLNTDGHWAFLFADMRDEHDAPIDYTGTHYAQGAAQGGHSKSYAALLREQGGAWTVVQHSTGPTDAAWLAWADAGAPDALFRIEGD